ncbi:MAG: HAD family hydrolase [Micropruina sp.]|uniref:HAD family hydrolase n=1 Tax=Micropruina sp. TaxID=2737536 RepID=UPI0039E5EB64
MPSEPIDLRLVVTDLDGTLLDADGRIPDRLWGVLERLRQRGIVLAPASGRQYPILRRMFSAGSDGMAFIAENGTYVVRDGSELSSSPLEREVAEDVVRTARALALDGRDLGLVWCGRDTAYVDRSDRRFIAEVEQFFASLEIVDDLFEVEEDAIKMSAFDFDGSAAPALILEELCAPHQVVASSPNWVDVMSVGVNKGAALRVLQRELDVRPDQTVVFGDYLNDLEMISQTPHSFAMANAHPRILEAARYVAPSNAEHGVLVVLEDLLEASERAA